MAPKQTVGCIISMPREDLYAGAEEVDAAGQRRQNIPRRQAAGLEQCVPAFRHPDAADRPSSFAGSGPVGCPPLSLHAGEPAPGPFLVLPGAGSRTASGAAGQQLSPGPHDQPGAGNLRPAGAVLPQPDCRGVLPLHHRRQRRPGVSQDSDSGLCFPARWHLHPTGGGSSGLAHAPGPSRVGRQLPEGGRSGFHEPPGGKCFPDSGAPGAGWFPPPDGGNRLLRSPPNPG